PPPAAAATSTGCTPSRCTRRRRAHARPPPPAARPRRARPRSARPASRRRARSRRNRSLRQLFACRLAHHVLRVPVRPVRVLFADPFLVLAVGGGGTPQRLRQLRRRLVARRHRRLLSLVPGRPTRSR